MGDPGDHGDADPVVAAALAAFAAGQESEHAALTALAGARLLVPVVAVLAELADDEQAGEVAGPEQARTLGDHEQAGAAAGGGAGNRRRHPRREKVSEMALPTLVGKDGRHAVLAFTCLDALTRWRADARPVPVPASRVWLAARHEAGAAVIDVAGPVPLAGADGSTQTRSWNRRAVGHSEPKYRMIAPARPAPVMAKYSNAALGNSARTWRFDIETSLELD